MRRGIDPGWPFLLAGLAMCAACIIVPAQRDLHGLTTQAHVLAEQERAAVQRLHRYAEVLDALRDASPATVQRLAAANFNVIPAGQRPVVRVADAPATVVGWIDRSLAADLVPAPTPTWTDTTLSRLADGRHRLWILAASVLCVFIGCLLGTDRFAAAALEADDEDPADADALATATAAGLSGEEAADVLVDDDSRWAPPGWRDARAPRAPRATTDVDDDLDAAGAEGDWLTSDWSWPLTADAADPWAIELVDSDELDEWRADDAAPLDLIAVTPRRRLLSDDLSPSKPEAAPAPEIMTRPMAQLPLFNPGGSAQCP